MIWFRLKQILILGLCGLLILLLSLSLPTPQPATAMVRQLEEAPGQLLLQSRHSLRDKTGKSWQVVLFKRTTTGELANLSLRVVGFPGVVEFAHPQPLKIITGNGETLIAHDMFAQQSPAPNVGQYDLEDVLLKLPITEKVSLELPLVGNNSLQLPLPSPVLLEWQTIAKS